MERSKNTAGAESFLREQLSTGPKLVSDLVKVSAHGYRALERAALYLGITRSRAGRRGPWVWSLLEYLPPAAEPVPEKEPYATDAEPLAHSPVAASVGQSQRLYYWTSINRDSADLSQRPMPVTVRCVPTPQQLLGFADARIAGRAQRAWVMSPPAEREQQLEELLSDDVVIIQPDRPQRPSIFTQWFPE